MKQYKLILNSLALLVLVTFSSAFMLKPIALKEWVTTNADIRFSVKNFGLNTKGTLSGLNAKIIFNPNDMNGNLIDANVQTTSINTDNSMRDNHLRKPEYFDVAKFDKIYLKATSFTKESNGSFKGVFKLTIKDVTKDVVIPFTFTESGEKAAIKGSFSINRIDYGVGKSSMSLSNDVTININLGLSPKK